MVDGQEPVEQEPTPNPDENLSLESLGVENNAESEEVQQEPEITPERKLLFEELARQSDSHTKGLESAVSEPRELAEGLTKYESLSPDFLKNYLEIKKQRGLFGELDIETLQQEILTVETKIISPLIEQLKNNDFELSGENIEHCISGAREAFYGMVLNERLTADKIIEILDGGIFVHKEPGQEISEEHRHLEKVAAYLERNHEQKKFNIHLYESLFSENKKDIAFLFRHEFFHAAAYSIWGKRYVEFQEAARNPEQNITAFEDVPELQDALILVSNPDSIKPFARDYIVQLLEASENAETEDDKAFYRQQAAIEIVADFGAHFLEGSKTSDVYLDLRARYFAENPEELIKTICRLEGVDDTEHLFQNYSINPAEVPPQEIIKRLSESDNLKGLFRSSTVWQEGLTDRFKNRGEKLKLQEFNEEFSEEDINGEIELEDNIPFLPAIPRQDSQGSGEPKQKGLLGLIWEIATGK